MEQAIKDRLLNFQEKLIKTNGWTELNSIIEECTAFFSILGYSELITELENHIETESYANTKSRLLGFFDALSITLSVKDQGTQPSSNEQVYEPSKTFDKSKVFIVHGHDNALKETIARFVTNIGLKPIILHEQPSLGFTIIEKLEHFGEVGFAAILLTPDDVGAAAGSEDNLKFRARQNVILELGYFLGSLSRNRVCVLYKSEVEIPSDYSGVVYIAIDEPGAWKMKFTQELINSGMQVELEGLLNT